MSQAFDIKGVIKWDNEANSVPTKNDKLVC